VQSESGMRYATDHAAAAAGLEPGEGVGTVSLLASCPTFAFGPYLCMRYGSPTTIWRSWDPEAALRRLAETDVRWLMCVPTHVLQLAEAARGTGVRLDRMRAIACGGGPMDERLMVDAEEALGVTVLRMFGMSECLGHTTVALTDRPEIRLSTEGYPFAGTEQRIVDGAGRPVRNGAVGEIQVRGPSLLLGYARAGRLERPPLERGGYFATGDLAARRPDGRLKITGRKKDVIMRGGKGIDPVEVELALARHPAVDQVCVVGVPDPVMGERVAAAFVGAGGSTVEPDDLRAYLEREGIARHKHPEHLLPIEELPRTGTGKVARAEVKELVEGLVAGGRSASPVPSSNG
jgi:cyclohexanecarboxylate-CoA ligase